MKNNHFVLSLLSVFILLASCDKGGVVNAEPQDRTPTQEQVPGDVPTVITDQIFSITDTTFDSGGNVTADGHNQVTARGIIWGDDHNLTVNLITKTVDGTNTGQFTSKAKSLQSGHVYYFRAYATNANGTGYGLIDSILTSKKPLPSEVTLISSATTSLNVSGEYSDGYRAPVLEKGFLFSITNSSPTLETNETYKVSDVVGEIMFTGELTGLSPNTNYYVRVFVRTALGTVYGPAKPVQTLAEQSQLTVPVIQVVRVATGIEYCPLMKVINDGGVPVTKYVVTLFKLDLQTKEPSFVGQKIYLNANLQTNNQFGGDWWAVPQKYTEYKFSVVATNSVGDSQTVYSNNFFAEP